MLVGYADASDVAKLEPVYRVAWRALIFGNP
jgi:hypothetical protein